MNKITKLFIDKITCMDLPLKVMEVKEFDEIYQVILVGGNNGDPDWYYYLNNLAELMESIDCWLIKIDNDVLDDIHYIYLGVKK